MIFTKIILFLILIKVKKSHVIANRVCSIFESVKGVTKCRSSSDKFSIFFCIYSFSFLFKKKNI